MDALRSELAKRMISDPKASKDLMAASRRVRLLGEPQTIEFEGKFITVSSEPQPKISEIEPTHS